MTSSRFMAPALEYEGEIYRVAGGNWRGRDGHTVHLLTWVSDDLIERGAPPADVEARDRWLAREVAARLGERARVVGSS